MTSVENGKDVDADDDDDEEEEDLEKLQAEIARMEEEAARITRETEELEKSKASAAAAAAGTGATAGADKKDFDPKAQALRDAKSVYVGQVDYSTTPTDLLGHFEACGQVERVTIVCDKYTGKPKGYAYLEFQDESSVENAIKLDGSEFKGRNLKVTHKRVNQPAFMLQQQQQQQAAVGGIGGTMGGEDATGRGRGRGAFRGGRSTFRGGAPGYRGGYRGGGYRGGGGRGFRGGRASGYHPYY